MTTSQEKVVGQLADVHQGKIYPAEVVFENGIIIQINPVAEAPDQWIVPGFVDAHVHIESSMLAPARFAPLALAHGTIATVSDPHEIANVLGIEGVRWMYKNGKNAPLHFHFGAPSCVPATIFESAGAEVTLSDIEDLFTEGTCHYLAEMMNWPGVIFHDPGVQAKLDLSKKMGKPIDGHAPGLMGEQAKAYFAKGIETDHECFTLEEARGKAALGVKILIREGSAARNFEALIPLIGEYPEQIMFCSDDKHPDDLLLGHINLLVKRALKKGYDLFDVLRAATINPMNHYKLPCGQLRVGDAADFVVLNSLENIDISEVYRHGKKVVAEGKTLWQPEINSETPNHFSPHYPPETAYAVHSKSVGSTEVRVIEAIEGQLITREIRQHLQVEAGLIKAAPDLDVLKITVVNRYVDAPPAVAFISGFGLKNAAIASSVAHDSHNVVAVGSSDALLKRAVDVIMEAGGGICVVHDNGTEILPLPIAGLMSNQDGAWVGTQYERLTKIANAFHSKPKAPFMLLSFMALLVIPALKLSDKGLFNGVDFSFVDMETGG